MIEATSALDPRSAFRAAATATARRLGPGHGIPLTRHLALLAEAELPAPPAYWSDASAMTVAAQLCARARRDALADGAAVVRDYFDDVRLRRPAALSSSARAHLYSGVGEYCAAIGWPQMATRFGTEALLFADAPAERYRALSVAALGYALNGEYTPAEALRAEADDVFRASDWPDADRAYLLFLADALIGAARLDVDRLSAIPHRMRRTQADDPSWAYTARAIEVMASLLRRDYGEARARARELLHASSRHDSQRMIRHFVVCILSDVYLAQDDAAQSLGVLEPYDNPEGHGICFSMQRAGALLRLGRESDLLRETAACVASESDHCLRTLTPVLLRRALAFDRLGDLRRARQSMEAALLIIERTGTWATPFLMLPRDETLALIDAAAAHQPALREGMPHLRAVVAEVTVPDDAPAPSPAPLTPTERELVDQLASPLSLAEIARARGVSLNTVKSQLRSISLKLGASGRADVVERLAAGH